VTEFRHPWRFLEERKRYKWIHVIHFVGLMVVVLLNSIAWINYAPKPEATKLNITTNTLFQGLCNMALLIWKAFFFSFDVLKEEGRIYIVIQIVCAILFETLLPRVSITFDLYFFFLFGIHEYIWHIMKVSNFNFNM